MTTRVDFPGASGVAKAFIEVTYSGNDPITSGVPFSPPWGAVVIADPSGAMTAAVGSNLITCHVSGIVVMISACTITPVAGLVDIELFQTVSGVVRDTNIRAANGAAFVPKDQVIDLAIVSPGTTLGFTVQADGANTHLFSAGMDVMLLS